MKGKTSKLLEAKVNEFLKKIDRTAVYLQPDKIPYTKALLKVSRPYCCSFDTAVPTNVSNLVAAGPELCPVWGIDQCN